MIYIYYKDVKNKVVDSGIVKVVLRPWQSAYLIMDLVMEMILVVDDRATDRELLVTLIRYHGHRISEAGDDGGP